MFSVDRPIVRFERGGEYIIPAGISGDVCDAYDLNRNWMPYTTKKRQIVREVATPGDVVILKVGEWLFRVSKNLVQQF